MQSKNKHYVETEQNTFFPSDVLYSVGSPKPPINNVDDGSVLGTIILVSSYLLPNCKEHLLQVNSLRLFSLIF